MILNFSSEKKTVPQCIQIGSIDFGQIKRCCAKTRHPVCCAAQAHGHWHRCEKGERQHIADNKTCSERDDNLCYWAYGFDSSSCFFLFFALTFSAMHVFACDAHAYIFNERSLAFDGLLNYISNLIYNYIEKIAAAAAAAGTAMATATKIGFRHPTNVEHNRFVISSACHTQ